MTKSYEGQTVEFDLGNGRARGICLRSSNKTLIVEAPKGNVVRCASKKRAHSWAHRYPMFGGALLWHPTKATYTFRRPSRPEVGPKTIKRHLEKHRVVALGQA